MTTPFNRSDPHRRVLRVQGLVLPVPPSANRWWRNVGGRTLKSEEARLYQALAHRTAIVAGVRPIAAPAEVSLSLVWYRERRMGDLDKRIGVVLDALIGAAYDDDKQIVELHALRVEDKVHPRVEVTVYEFAPYLPRIDTSREAA
jgi:crossover junction endodeoxyribonuclease RusA